MEPWERYLVAAGGAAAVAAGGYLGYVYLKDKGGLGGIFGPPKACTPEEMTGVQIAQAMGVSVSALQGANPQSAYLQSDPGEKLKAGTCLIVPKGGTVPQGWKTQ
jgi:hypothetical protein